MVVAGLMPSCGALPPDSRCRGRSPNFAGSFLGYWRLRALTPAAGIQRCVGFLLQERT